MASVVELDLLICCVVSLWTRISTTPQGFALEVTERAGHEGTARALRVRSPKTDSQGGGPRCFGDFAAGCSLPLKEAYAWFARMRLRYSCSSLACIFVRHVVPALARSGVTHARLASGDLVALGVLRVHNVYLGVPRSLHFLLLDYVSRTREEPIECICGPPRHVSHTIIVCSKTSLVIDLAIGQYTGSLQPTMQPTHDSSLDALAHRYPAGVLGSIEARENEIQGQLERDVFSSRLKGALPARRPEVFAEQVVTDLARGWAGFCRHCLCAPPTGLRRCTRCERASYCGPACQKLHWKAHKGDCAPL